MRIDLTGLPSIATKGPAAYGVETLAGFVVRDPEGMARAIGAGARPKEFAPFGRFVHLQAPAGTVATSAG